ncbi:hypothetical protein HN385_02245 [archaeon]|jgi:hypothetical protein|nr:hypothetical protein [archaeon]MBT3450375.1 hypothetical protein [archaeon]MBT6868850.1 hypothetical protein [archaeon]MBT7192929.1 hypothetical protein [archaeon]MBT7380895.1 hypothetical protein [archaeon]
MIKLKLIGLGNNGYWNYFIFQKDNHFLSIFPTLLEKLDLSKTSSLHEFVEEKYDINEKVDLLEQTQNQSYDLEIFYGKDKIIVVIRTEEKNREDVLDKIKDISEFKGF